jgi:Subtilase family
MVEELKSFRHLSLKLARQGIAIPARGGGNKNPRTPANSQNRQHHGSTLQRSALKLVSDWQENQTKREEEEKPDLPESISLILQIDPKAFNPEDLKQYGIEVIAELENGYIIGASVDLELTDLQEKIRLFLNEQRGGGKVAEFWEILDSIRRPEYILSPDLLSNWGQVQDQETYTVDVGVACVGTQAQLPDSPIQKTDESDDKYAKRVAKWINKRDLTYQQWDEIASHRQEQLLEFIEGYTGEICSTIDGNISSAAQLPDSFTCRIKLSGKGLKDLVLNFPYVFDVCEPDEISETISFDGQVIHSQDSFELEPPQLNAPKVCVIDSGIQERHSFLSSAVHSQSSKSWIPGQINQTADQVSGGGHGTRVAGAILYPRDIPKNGTKQAECWIQNARVLDQNCSLPKQLFPPDLLSEVVSVYHQQTKTRIFNHSITGSVPCLTRYMSSWAAAIDELTWHNDVLFIVAAGNLPIDSCVGITRLSIRDHLANNRLYPDYLLEKSCRVANPAQSFQALTVGSIASTTYNQPPYSSISKTDYASAFSCSGLGIWDTIKPEVVEYGGDLTIDESTLSSITQHESVCPELIRSTLNGGPAISRDAVGTSFAAPKVSHIAARLAAAFPDENCLLYRALIVQSARWPDWVLNTNGNKSDAFRQIGYGIPNVERALENSPNRITLITQGDRSIKAREAHIYQVNIPDDIRAQGEEIEILIEVTLSYKAQPRRTRRNRRKYLSTWLDWDCSKRGEDPERFLERTLKAFDAPEGSDRGETAFPWMLSKQTNHGTTKDISRNAGTLQKDWSVVKSFDLRESFCIAIVGHQGWNNDPEAQAPYSLVVSFEASQSNIPIYASFAEIQVEALQVKERVQVQVTT